MIQSCKNLQSQSRLNFADSLSVGVEGIEPTTSRSQSERSTDELDPGSLGYYFISLLVMLQSRLAIETKLTDRLNLSNKVKDSSAI